MPPKTRKFLDIIHEKLYRNELDDPFLIFEESDFRKAGFSVGEIEEIIVFLKKQNVVSRYNSYRVSKDTERLPITREDKARRLKWAWNELFAGQHPKYRYALELVSREAFYKVYTPATSNSTDSSRDNKQRGAGGDGGKVLIFAKEMRGDGKILANGGDGSVGGKGGEVHIVAEKNKYAGDISARGGKSDSQNTFSIHDSQLHFGSGDNIGRDKNKNPQPSLLSKYWWGFFIPIVVGVIIFLITNGNIQRLFNVPITPSHPMSIEAASSTVNIWDILSRADGFGTSLERDSFLEKYKDSNVYGVGSFNDINKNSDAYYVFMYVGKYPVACSFENVNSSTERELLLLRNGNNVSFTGTFVAGNLNGAAWYVQGCSLSE